MAPQSQKQFVEIIEKLQKENDNLKKRLQQQVRLTEEFQSKLAALINAPLHSELSKQAKLAATQVLRSRAEKRTKACKQLWGILLHQYVQLEECWISTSFCCWQKVTELAQEDMRVTLGAIGGKGIAEVLKDIRNETVETVFKQTFLHWRELVLVSHRRRERPFLEQNEQSFLVNKWIPHLPLSHILCRPLHTSCMAFPT